MHTLNRYASHTYCFRLNMCDCLWDYVTSLVVALVSYEIRCLFSDILGMALNYLFGESLNVSICKRNAYLIVL